MLPFLLVHLFLYLANHNYTGFIQGDQPYYVANGRAIFERGNGIGYPNPYDYHSSAPIVYYHWLPWVFGFFTSLLGLDPGITYFIVGAIAAILTSRIVLALLQDRIAATDANSYYLLFACTWGSGVLVLWTLLVNLFSSQPWNNDLLRYDPYGGWWFLDWGRNMLYATEAVYHLLVAWTWLMILRRRYQAALLPIALIAATHPWTGIEVIATIAVWSAVQFLRQDRSQRPSWSFYLGFAAISILFLWYYELFLPSIPEHKGLTAYWYYAWLLPMKSFLLSHFYVLVIATVYLWKKRGKINTSDFFLIIVASVAFLLSKHDLFVSRPLQPLHFTRGYMWLALALLGAPYAAAWLTRLRERKPSSYLAVPLLLLAIGSIDTATFLIEKPKAEGLYLSSEGRQLFRVINTLQLHDIFACEDSSMSFLAGTYTSARPFLGQIHVTPYYYERSTDLHTLYTSGVMQGYAKDITLLTDSTMHPKLHLDSTIWSRIYNDKNWILYRRH